MKRKRDGGRGREKEDEILKDAGSMVSFAWESTMGRSQSEGGGEFYVMIAHLLPPSHPLPFFPA